MALDISTKTAGVVLPPKLSGEIWQTAQEGSAIMALAGRIDLPAEGTIIETILSDPEAEWVGETDPKPVDTSTFGSRLVQGYKMAVIEPFSDEFRRDKKALYNAVARRLPNALARKFDETVLGTTAPGSNFDVLGGSAVVGIGGAEVWKNLVAVHSAVTANGADLNGWGITPQASSLLIAATDGFGRPLLVPSITGSGATFGSLLGAPVYKSKALFRAGTPNIIGIAGDWSHAKVGVVDGIKISQTDVASLEYGGETVHLWQRNMFALRAEFTVGFRVRDLSSFVRLSDAVPAP